jgi:putative transposase
MLASKECQHLAAQLFAETIARHGVEPGLQVHADRGSAMKSDTLAQLFDSLGVSRSFSRPRVSDDNPFSEAQFKTLKYQPDYPGAFASSLHGRGYLQDFFAWHNDEHHHSGLALFTPAEVFYGRVPAVAAIRQATLDAAYQAHPERFPNGAPRVRLPPDEVHINPITTESIPIKPSPSTEAPLPVVPPAIAQLAAAAADDDQRVAATMSRQATMSRPLHSTPLAT